MKTNLFALAAFILLIYACADQTSFKESLNDAEVTSRSADNATTDQIERTPTGGSGAYTYAWTDGSTEKKANMPVGTYSVAVTDVNGNSTSPAGYQPPSYDDEQQIDVSRIIKTGSLGMNVADYAKTISAIRHEVNLSGGYVANEGERRDQYQVSNTVTIRVPAKNFESLIAQISAGADTLTYRNIQTQDVGEEYTDLAARLNAKRAVEKRYLDILKKADTIPDILRVEEKLSQIREEIESTEGRMRYLDNKIGLSTITVNVSQKFAVEKPEPQVAGFFSKLLTSLTIGWNGVLGFVLALATSWPVWIIVAAAVYSLRKFYLRRKEAREMYA